MNGDTAERLLISRCPTLESIVLHKINGLEKLKLSLPSSSRLKHLELCDCYLLDDVQVLDAPSLISFKLNRTVEHCLLRNLPKLVDLSVSIGSHGLRPFSSFFSRLKRLEMASYQLEGSSRVGDAPGIRDRHWESQQQGPTAVLDPGSRSSSDRNDIVLKPLKDRRGFEHLKVLGFYGYYGGDWDDVFLWYFVENAESIETVVIDPNYQPPLQRSRTTLESYLEGCARSTWDRNLGRRIIAAKEFGKRLPHRITLVIA